MGGRVWVESEVGAGSTFHFTVRFGEPAPEHRIDVARHAEAGGKPAIRPGRSLRILVAEDSEDTRFVLEAYLRDSGHQVDFAENGEAAVEKFRSGPYDLVLMDVQMPLLDGYSATHRIRAWELEGKREPTPIVALTAYAADTERMKAAAAGCNSCLTKPILFEAFMDVIEAYGGARRSAASPELDAKLRALQPAYLASRRHDVKALRSALAATDFEAIRLLGHRIAGTGGAYGFPQISAIGELLEAAAQQRDSAAVRARIAELEEYLARRAGTR
jgi:CheY-like chemotaxis protein